MSNSDSVYCSVTCTEDGYGYDQPTYLNGAWTYWFLEAGLISNFGGTTNLEACHAWADGQYNPGGGDEPMEFDGNTGADFYL